MKKLLAIIFLAIFTFQILPVKAIGKLLCSNQMTEEVHEHGCSKKMTNDHNKLWYLHFMTAPNAENEPEICFKHAFRDEALIKCLHLDVPLQPPNRA